MRLKGPRHARTHHPRRRRRLLRPPELDADAFNIATVTFIVCSLAAVIANVVYHWRQPDSIDDILRRVRKHHR